MTAAGSRSANLACSRARACVKPISMPGVPCSAGLPQGSVYGRPEYLAALCEATGASYRIVGVFLNDQLVGGVPLYERRQRAGTIVANRTLLYYNGIVLDLPPRKFHSDATAQTAVRARRARAARGRRAVTRTSRCTTMAR